MTLCGNPLLQSQLRVMRTLADAAHMSAFDPKRTLALVGLFLSLDIEDIQHGAFRCRGASTFRDGFCQ